MLTTNFIERSYPPQKVERGALIFSEGNVCSAVPFVKDGVLKVYLISQSGRELTLYRVLPNQMCIIAMLTAYSKGEYPAYTVAEEDSYVCMIPSEVAIRWFEENHWWRSLFMRVLSENLLNLMAMLNSMVSESVRERLISYLLSCSKDGSLIEKTHEEIAKDIGSARVVVSRVLKELEREGFIILRRGGLFIKDHEALSKRADRARL